MNFVAKLKRRKVVKTLSVYSATSFIIISLKMKKLNIEKMKSAWIIFINTIIFTKLLKPIIRISADK